MDFFGQQSKVQNSSFVLLLMFFLAVTGLTFLVAWSVSVINNIVSLEREFLTLTPIGLLVAGFFWLAIGFGCFFRWLDVRGGGSRLAQRFGAVRVELETRSAQEKQLLAVNAEMAIAASIPEPSVWVMPYEHPINAFVVGGGDDIALVVTHGAINDLQREELQAVVGHEMGHIVKGDLAINMRLLMVLGGFMALTEVGDTLGENFVGSIFRVVGGICVFTGTLIRSAFSRRREFLADAMAVQFTRNPEAMAAALGRIRDHQDPEHLECRYRQELAHLCFYTRDKRNWFARKLASHPRIDDRIKAIDPHFAVKDRNRKRTDRSNQGGSEGSEQTIAANTGVHTGSSTADAVISHPGVQMLAGTMMMGAMDGNPDVLPQGAGSEAVCENGFGIVGDRMALMVPDAATSLAAIFALFASQDNRERMQYLNSIAFAYQQPFADKVAMLDKTLGADFRRDPLRVLQHASSKLRGDVQPQNRRHLLKNLEKLLEIEHETTVVNYACLTLLRRWLDAEHPVLSKVVSSGDIAANDAEHDKLKSGDINSIPASKIDTASKKTQGKKIPRLDTIGSEIGLLLSLLLEASGNRDERNLEDYRRVMLSYTSEFIPLRSQHEQGIVSQMKTAFEALQAQPVSVRQAFIEHCSEVIVSDFEVTQREHLLLTLFSVALDVDQPVPGVDASMSGERQAANF